MKDNYFKSKFWLNSFNNRLFYFLFTPECRIPEKRLESLVDRIFYDDGRKSEDTKAVRYKA